MCHRTPEDVVRRVSKTMCLLAVSPKPGQRHVLGDLPAPVNALNTSLKRTCKHLIVSSRILMPLGDLLDSPQAKRAVTSSEFCARLSCTAKLYQISICNPPRREM